MSKTTILIAHNLRSCHNVGSLLRTAEGLGIYKVYLTGYTPYPMTDNDTRLPHESAKLHKQIQKTALGAEKTQTWEHTADVLKLIEDLKREGFRTAALEQAPQSKLLPEYRAEGKTALVLGREVEGVEPEVLAACEDVLEIPMVGKKESFNVVQAAAMALYHITFVT
jgi:23S rRNA (guanosine2251-2'-O)-methyltransferase